MAIYKRADSPFYWFKFKLNGTPVRESAGTTDAGEARAAEARRRLELRGQRKRGLKTGYRWEDAVVGYLDTLPESDTKRNARYSLKWLGQHLFGRPLEDIDENMLIEIQQRKLADINRKKAAAAARGRPSRWANAQPSGVNRIFTGLVSPILHYAKRRKWLEAVPEMPRLAEAERDPVWASREKAMKLLLLLPRHQMPMVIFDLEVGWRRRNITHLTWAQIDLERRFAWVSAEAAKEGKGIPTPLSDVAVEVLEAQVGKHPTWVFPYRGRALKQTSTRAYRAARDAAGLPPTFTWHALRHTWATWHRMDGTPLDVLRELGGWTDDKMVERYAHFDGSHLEPYVLKRAALPVEVAATLERGHNRGHAAGGDEVGSTAKSLIQKQSGNSSVGRAQPCQGRRRSPPLRKSST